MNEKNKRIIALIACAGSGKRAGLPYNKLLYKVCGKAVAGYTLGVFIEAKRRGTITDIIMLCAENDRAEFERLAAEYRQELPSGEKCHEVTERSIPVLTGGATRAQSVKNGLEYIGKNYEGNPVVLICDGARPNCSLDLIERCAGSALLYGSGVAAVPVSDTVKIVSDGAVSSGPGRKGLYLAQTPQAFEFDALYGAYKAAGADADEMTDDSAVMERWGKAGLKIRLVEGGHNNYKITSKEDIMRFEAEKMPCAFRIGNGSDTHRLVSGRKLVLGGVTIPHPTGLQGHSDADALIHSVIDALLSAAALRDIGFHFPDTDPAYKDAESAELLRKTAALLQEKRASVVNVSAVIHAEKPKMSPYIPQMAENIANALYIEKERISISAKTGEGTGIVGEEKAVICETVCLITF